MKRRTSRRNPEALTPEQRANRYRAESLQARAIILQYGVAQLLGDGLLEPQEHDACKAALDEAYTLSVEADGINVAIRAAQRATDEAEDAPAVGERVQ